MKLFEIVGAELPLVIFTVLTQCVVGLIFVYTPAFIKGYKNKDELYKFGLFSSIFMLIAIIPAIFHLGDISHALNLIRRLGVFKIGDSWHIGWMNNEVAFLGLCLVFAFLLYFLKKEIFLYISLFCGILGIFFMAGAYGSMQETVTTWRFDITLVYFFSSGLYLGGLAYHLFFAKNLHEEKMAFLMGLIGSGILLSSVVFQTLHLGDLEVAGITNVFNLLHGDYAKIVFYGASFMGFGMITWYFNGYLRQKNKFIALIAFISAMIGVLMTRIIFYGLINTHIMH